RNKLFPRRLRLRIAIHESLNRNAIPLSRKILPAEHRKDGYPTWAVTGKITGNFENLRLFRCSYLSPDNHDN
ncbi:MAG TPA: hypothetical protein VKT99_23110, partial [Xanthobacteraceae bacterium]|nr:hypothetical protein [Xanthobacteraceae bacterium]